MAAGSLLEVEIVTADGTVLIANTCTNPDLFWAIKGGGGGSFGVVTRLTLRTHELPAFFGAVFATIKASSPEAFRRLIAKTLEFYAEALFNPHWGEQLVFRPGNELGISMVFQGLDQQQAEAVWRPFFGWVSSQSEDLSLEGEPMIIAAPARNFWNPEFLRQLPGLVLADDRPDAPEGNVFWASNLGEAGQVVHGYRSAWIPASFLQVMSARLWPPPCSVRRTIGAWRSTSTRALPVLPTGRSRLRATRPPTQPSWRLSRLLSAVPRDPRPIRGFQITNPTWPPPAGRPRQSSVPWTKSGECCLRSAPTCRKAISSRPLGRTPSGARTTPSCVPSRKNTIPMASSSRTMG